MFRSIFCPLLLLGASSGLSAQPPRVLRQPVATYMRVNSEGTENAISWANLSPDGKFIACSSQGGTLAVYAVGDAKPLFTAESANAQHPLYADGAAFSSDGKLIAFPVKGGRVTIRSARTGKPQASAELPDDKSEAVDALAFSPDGQKLAVSSGILYHKNLYLFDTGTGKLLSQPLTDVDGIAHQLVFSADGKRLIANHWRRIFLVDSHAHRLSMALPASAATVFFQGDKLFAVADESLTIHQITDQEVGGSAIGQFSERPERVKPNRIAVAGHPAVAAIPFKAEVSIRDMNGRELFRVGGEDSPVRKVSLSADGSILMVYRKSLHVELFRLE